MISCVFIPAATGGGQITLVEDCRNCPSRLVPFPIVTVRPSPGEPFVTVGFRSIAGTLSSPPSTRLPLKRTLKPVLGTRNDRIDWRLLAHRCRNTHSRESPEDAPADLRRPLTGPIVPPVQPASGSSRTSGLLIASTDRRNDNLPER